MKEPFAERDQKVIWHPYTQHGLRSSPLPVLRGRGSYLELEGGQRLLDAIASWWVNIHGHSHPQIIEAIERQAKTLEHVLFAGFTHKPAIELAELLIRETHARGGSYSKVFYSDNGSTSVEIALKMAYQKQYSQSLKQCQSPVRSHFLALEGSYHGDTLGAMSVGDPKGFHPIFRKLLPSVHFLRPNDLLAFKNHIEEHCENYVAFIAEPLVQGAGGMRFVDPVFLKEALKICKQKKILTIFDEVFTGFYRTGTAFAFEQVGATPDFLCLSKGITGGFLPLAVTLTTEAIFESFSTERLEDAFLHGHSYTANPMACAAALESWKLLQEPETQKRIQTIGKETKAHLERFHGYTHRSLGPLGVIEIPGEKGYYASIAREIREKAMVRGVLLRPLGNVLYTVPPYCMTTEELSLVYDVIESILRELKLPASNGNEQVTDVY